MTHNVYLASGGWGGGKWPSLVACYFPLMSMMLEIHTVYFCPSYGNLETFAVNINVMYVMNMYKFVL